MKSKRNKFFNIFIACLHCSLIALPLLVLIYNVGRLAIEKNFSNQVTYVYDNNGNYQESSKVYEVAPLVSVGFNDTLQDFGVTSSDIVSSQSWSVYYESQNTYPFLFDFDFFGMFSNGNPTLNPSSLSMYAYINFYLNWIISMSVIVFIPEILIVFIYMCRKLIYSFSNRIEGGF